VTISISTKFTDGGASVGKSTNSKDPALAEALRGLANDVAGARFAEITTADIPPAAGATPTAAEFDAAALLINELKAAINSRNSAPTSPVLTAGASEPYDLSSAVVLTVEIDGTNRVFTFQASDFADPTLATAAEAAGALNSRGYVQFGVVASDNAGDLELTGPVGATHSLQGVAGGANAEFLLPTTQVNGTGFVPGVVAS
jgi:hypothetical protein